MTAGAWVSLDHAAAPELLRRAFGLEFPPMTGDWTLSLDDLGRIARASGFTMNVRPAELSREGEATAGPHLLLRGDRFLTVLDRGASWLLLDADARFVRAAPRDVIELICTPEERDALERGRAALKEAGASPRMVDRVVGRLGIHRALELAEWTAGRREAIRDVDALLAFALDHTALLPKEWIDRGEPSGVRQISFDRQMRLGNGKALRSAVAQLIRSESSLLFSLLGVVAVGIPIGYLVPLCLAFLIDRARTAGDAPATLFLVLVTALVVGALLGGVRAFGFVRLGARVRIRLLNALLFRLLGCRIQDLRRLSDGDLSVRLSDLVVAQQLVFGQTLPSVLSTLMLAGGLFYLGTVAPELLVPLGVAVACVAALYALVAPRLRGLTRDRLVTVSTWRDRLIERFEGWKLFRHLDPGHRLLSRIDPVLSATADLNQRATALGALLGGCTALIALLFLAAAWWSGVHGFQTGRYSLGQFLVLMGLALAVFRGVVALASLVTAWVRAEPSIRRLRELVEHSEAEPLSAMLRGTGSRTRAGIEIDDLSFAWPDRPPVLEHVSLSVGPGEWVAIVGPSGSGKSTLAYILGGLIEPASGSVSLGGENAGPLHPDVMRRRVAVVPQEPTLFDATFKENIVAGCESASEAALARAVEASDLAAFVQKRRRGLDEFVGENGTQVSVGEKMRVALARALIREPDLLVLDETFGHLDDATTERIVENLKRERRAVVVLTHNPALARRCDRAFALHEGRLADMDRTS